MQFPDGSVIAEQAALDGYYTDCFSIDKDSAVTLADFITAFYKTPLFRLERLLLKVTPKGGMSDADVDALARSKGDSISMWQVEQRREAEILLSAGRTKSWLMVSPHNGGTRLFFGTVVVPEPPKRAGQAPRLGPVFDSLMGAHKVYSRLLLGSAAQKLSRV
jgi:hypothetical protein